MHPTVDEQLREARRILEEVVEPEVQTDYPADTLRAVLSALQMLEGLGRKCGRIVGRRSLAPQCGRSPPFDGRRSST